MSVLRHTPLALTLSDSLSVLTGTRHTPCDCVQTLTAHYREEISHEQKVL